ncbi:MAG: HlyD family efflux transporter periplasmic adaptor subunit [Balneolaceae bacterium]|nr:HlyD family efflux transporter periplasmic adaptor subunit [Balneolaceae bacterium]
MKTTDDKVEEAATHGEGRLETSAGTIATLLFLLTMVAGCTQERASDAWGQFEAQPVTVSAEVGGALLHFEVREGDTLAPGRRVGRVDTTQLAMQLEELQAQRRSLRARRAGVEAETEVARQELAVARGDLRRVEALAEEEAVTRQQLDDARGRVSTLEKRVQALEAQQHTVSSEAGPLEVRIRQVRDRLRRTSVVNPIRGRVLTTMVEQFELVGAGQPLYEIAALDTLMLRVYVSGGQLTAVRLGQSVEVLVDSSAAGLRSMRGTVSWIASQAEFTPRMIQTREERVSQVYAVKVRVPNPGGRLKIGMPGEVRFEGVEGSP